MGGTEKYQYKVIVKDPYARKLLPDYLARKKMQTAEILRALESKDYESIENIAHRLYGSGAAYGLDTISAFGDKLEQAARRRDTELVEKLTKDLSHYLENLTIA